MSACQKVAEIELGVAPPSSIEAPGLESTGAWLSAGTSPGAQFGSHSSQKEAHHFCQGHQLPAMDEVCSPPCSYPKDSDSYFLYGRGGGLQVTCF